MGNRQSQALAQVLTGLPVTEAFSMENESPVQQVPGNNNLIINGTQQNTVDWKVWSINEEGTLCVISKADDPNLYLGISGNEAVYSMAPEVLTLAYDSDDQTYILSNTNTHYLTNSPTTEVTYEESAGGPTPPTQKWKFRKSS